jgi:HEAT repeat protein
MHPVPITLVALLALSGAAAAQTPPEAARIADRPSDRAPAADEDLALAALEGLMAQSPERALPILRKVLNGRQSTLIKRRALFVLSQVNAPEARDILVQMSRSPDAGLRGEAIRSIGIGGDRRALDALQPIYSGGDAGVKKEVLQAWLIAGYKEAVYQAAVNAKNEDEAADATHILAAMGATEELRKLGERPNATKGLVNAFAISGDLSSLRKIAESHGERAVRIEAVRKIGIIHSEPARTVLRDLYSKSGDAEIKEAALQGMLIGRDDKGVLALYRAAKTSEEKRTLLRTLVLIDGDVALREIDSVLEQKP